MKCHVEKQDTGITTVLIEDVRGREHALLNRIRECRKSAWACPSAECSNIGSMEERIGDGNVSLTLTPRPGAQLDPAGIQECLRYMLFSTTQS